MNQQIPAILYFICTVEWIPSWKYILDSNDKARNEYDVRFNRYLWWERYQPSLFHIADIMLAVVSLHVYSTETYLIQSKIGASSFNQG